jgi:hypothetical protein
MTTHTKQQVSSAESSRRSPEQTYSLSPTPKQSCRLSYLLITTYLFTEFRYFIDLSESNTTPSVEEMEPSSPPRSKSKEKAPLRSSNKKSMPTENVQEVGRAQQHTTDRLSESNAVKKKDIETMKSPKSRGEEKAIANTNGTRSSKRRMARKPSMPDEEVLAKLKEICTDEDPTAIYTNMVKIGQG